MVKEGSLSEKEAKERLDGLSCDLLAENQKAVHLFMMVSTQWRCAEGVRIGLDYNTVFSLMAVMGVAKKERLPLLQDVQAMEDETLTFLARKREARHGTHQ